MDRHEDTLELMRQAVVELDEDRALELARQALAEGSRSLALLQVCEQATRVVGGRYEREEYFLSGLILAGEIFRQILEMARPAFEEEIAGTASGTILLGTVAGDIHDIGENIVATALGSFGFTVVDLGVNVPPERFLEAAREVKPDVIGLSGLIVASYDSMKRTVAPPQAPRGRARPTALGSVGGEAVDEQIRSYVGADSWTVDAMEGVRICQRLVERSRSQSATDR